METTYNSETYSGTAPDQAAGADIWAGIPSYAFNNATKILHVWSVNNHLLIRFSFRELANVDWQPLIQINNAPQSEPFYHSAQVFQVVNETNGAAAWFQVVGFW